MLRETCHRETLRSFVERSPMVVVVSVPTTGETRRLVPLVLVGVLTSKGKFALIKNISLCKEELSPVSKKKPQTQKHHLQTQNY